MVARATAVTTHRPALAATSTWAVLKYPADSTDCLPSHMTHRHTGTTRCQQHTHHTHTHKHNLHRHHVCPSTPVASLTQTHRHTTLHQQHAAYTHTTCTATTSIRPRLPRPTPPSHMHMPAAPRHPALLHTHTHTTTKSYTDTTRCHHPLCHRPQSRSDTGG